MDIYVYKAMPSGTVVSYRVTGCDTESDEKKLSI